ncbi:uncharacterized protein [Aquarana catesbeiana]|uniref:uncharacterized protein n=1 Tax=Aquarana catesbeiana TaxID=8400 RepID=UPI003CC949D0
MKRGLQIEAPTTRRRPNPHVQDLSLLRHTSEMRSTVSSVPARARHASSSPENDDADPSQETNSETVSSQDYQPVNQEPAAQEFTRFTKSQGSSNPKHLKGNALAGTVRRTPNTKAPMVTRAGAVKNSLMNAPGHSEPITNICATNSALPLTSTQVSNTNAISSQLDFCSAPIFFTSNIGVQKSYKSRPGESQTSESQFEVINLSSYPHSVEQISVLNLGLTFCPMHKVDQFELIKDLNLFSRKLMFKTLYDKPATSIQDSTLDNPLWKGMSINDIKAMEDLMELWEEGGLDETDLFEAHGSWPLSSPTPIRSSSHCLQTSELQT